MENAATESDLQPVITRRKSTEPSSACSAAGNAGRGPGGRISKVPSVTEDFMSGEPIRMTGFLEKRSKVLGWKKYWFVLDAHLLTYYKSEQEYEALSAFCGSINLGIATNVRPVQIKGTKGYPLQITTRTHVYYLRSLEKAVLDQWLLALQETISVPHKISSPVWADPGVQFYRYSFASSSQWSLAESTEDISTSLSHLPRNFYLKHESSAPKPLGQKCHSIANLPSMALNRTGSGNKRAGQDRAEAGASPVIRQSASMLVLESSAQAAELKNELARKFPAAKSPGGQPLPGIGKIDFSQVKLRPTPTSSLRDGLDESPADSVENLDDYAEVSPRHSSSRPLSAQEHTYESLDFGQNNNTRQNRTSLLSISEMPEAEMPFSDGNKKHRVIFSESLELDHEPRRDEKTTKRKKGIGGLLQKIFRKGSESGKKKPGPSMVITGPVDLRTHFQHTPTARPPAETDKVVEELKRRVGQVQRTVSEGAGFEKKSRTPLRRSTIDPQTEDVRTSLSSEEYREKLERFNRMSAQLSPSFLAALKTIPSFGSNNGLGQMARSQSCKIKQTCLDDEPPILPPKAKNRPEAETAKYSAYDVPRNNTPVKDSTDTKPERSRKISLKELLAKKNSAPEVLFQKPADEPALAVFSVPPPPPRPPKADSHGLVSLKHRYADQTEKLSSQDLSVSATDISLALPASDHVIEKPISPAASAKSVDIENLDVLSELSDMLSEASPPDTPPAVRTEDRNSAMLEPGLGHELYADCQCPIYSEPPLEAEEEDPYSLPPLEPESDPIYENIKYATISTIVTELETVEEQEDELSELYDEFPAEPLPTPSISTESWEVGSVRHSGMDELTNYLKSEASSEDGKPEARRKVGGALSRHGHSPALSHLQNLLQEQDDCQLPNHSSSSMTTE